MEYDFWEQIYRGATQFVAAEVAGVSEQTGRRWVRVSGGVRPRLVVVIGRDPGTRGGALTEFEREHIGLRRGHVGVRQIARELGRQPSTISRELSRHRAYDRRTHRLGYYSPLLAQSRADQDRRRPKTRRLAARPALAAEVQTGLEQRWSPRQIAVRLRADHPDDPEMQVSHETIYQSLYVQGRGGLRRELHARLRTGRKLRRPRAGTRRATATRSSIPDPVPISARPAESADRAVPGHWEGDLIIGSHGRSAIGTLVERTTRYCLLLHLPDGHRPSRSATRCSPRSPLCPTICGGR